MVNINKIILRGVLLLSYVAIIALIIFGISALFSYLNTGADRSTILHTEVKRIDQYLPKINWEPLNNEGRQIDSQTLSTIEKDYLNALYVKHIAYKSNLTTGLDDYYTESARENLYNLITTNHSQNISIEATTLEHHPTLEFFSEDGQLAVITDKDVIEYKRIYKNETLVLETTESATYKIILLLEDGFWRIRHIVVQDVSEHHYKINPVSVDKLNIKGINYYPQETPWDMFGHHFDAKVISKDFKIIKDAGLNTIRIFIPYEDFGKANVSSEKLEKLQQVLDLAVINNIKIVVTLFDFYGDYSVLNWTLNQRHVEAIITKFKDHQAIIAWDIKNEPDLDFESRNKSNVIAWLRNMTAFIKTIDQDHPITIGWSNAKNASLLKDDLDYVSFHYYEDIDDLETTFKSLKQIIVDKPIIISEFGISSYKGFWKPFGSSKKKQANYHEKAQDIFSKNNIQFMSWTLYDYQKIPKEVVGKLPWRKNTQKRFGFIDENGAKKEAFQFISN
ncbi:glycosyl hydrolase family 5 [Flavobacteriaceae bacterium AU392]|nr:glycosyl hydrolase family 5 [Flavobacteriaceae bacterium]RKM85907.1 glycosyl hydrolase family 5 [Flavobacteriaceae bacterium AU392]